MMFRKKPKLYKRISVLLVLILFLLSIVFPSNFALAQEINYCLTGTPAFEKLALLGSACAPIWYDTVANINDGDTDNYVGGWSCAPSPGNPIVWYNAIVIFTDVVDINRVEYIHYGARSAGTGDLYLNPPYIRTYLYYNSQWNLIDSRNVLMSKTTVSITTGAPWNDVTRVRIEARNVAQRLTPGAWTESRLFEIRAFGPAAPSFQDIGLRVQAPGGIVSIAAEIGVPTSPLRIAKDGVVYGIVLVNPGDVNDSGVRIQLASGEIKALRKL